MKKVAVMVLAGGEGKRMGRLCRQMPKPALPFASRFRVIDFSLSNCLHSQIENIAILTDWQRTNIGNYLRRWTLENADAGRFDLSILEPTNGHYRGTADAVFQNLDYLHKNRCDTVLVLAADHIYRMDYRQLLALHEQNQADVTIGVLPVSLNESCRFGTVRINSESRITDFAEKTDTPLSNLASMGIYAFKVEALVKRLNEDSIKLESRHDFGYSIIPGMVEQDRAFAFHFDGYWRDIGTTEAYYAANMEFLHLGSKSKLSIEWPNFGTNKEKADLPKIFSHDHVRDSLVSPGCIIKGSVENSILSPGVIVDEHATVKDSIIMNNVFVASHSQVESCIVSQRVNIGRSCQIGESHKFLPQPKEITVLEEDATIPPNTIFSRNSRTLPEKPDTGLSAGFSLSHPSEGAALSQ